MAEKSNKSSSRRIHNNRIDEQNRHNFNQEQLVSLTPEYLTTSAPISYKRRHCSITNEQTLSTQLPSNNQDFIYDQNFTMTSTVGTRKRSAQDDLITCTTHHFLPQNEQYASKRARYENSNNFELENQPPRSINKCRSLFTHHQYEQDRLSFIWNNLHTSNNASLLSNDIPSSSSSCSTTYHRTNSAPNHEHNLTEHYSPLLTEHHHSSIFHNNSLDQKSTISKSSKTNLRLLSPQSNGSNPLRTTNFFIDNKQQTIIRTGNISPANSDSSSESTSTCSSDEQLYHHYYYHFHQPQPWRSYRERENYEQLLDLAEKLSDPNRFNKVNIQQFFSYRYKASSITSTLSSKQTACVICMSHFKNEQHIRVLPCQHEYHSKCIARWFTMNSSCPICRRDNFLSSC